MFFPGFLILALAAAQPRVISTSPQMTEIVFQTGLESALVATSDFSRFPPQALRLPTIGGALAASVERTFSLSPTWVLADTHATSPDFLRDLKRLGIRVSEFDLQSVDGMFETGEAIAKGLNRSDIAERWSSARRCYRNLRPGSAFSFLALAWAEPLVIYGQKTFFSDLLQRLGGTNLAPSTRNRYPGVSAEFAVATSPDTVFFPRSQHALVERLARRWWPSRVPNLVPLDESLFSRSSLTPLKNLGQLQTRWEGYGARCLEPL